MGVTSHLGIRVSEYDERIRTFIPFYDEILDAAAAAVAVTSPRRAPAILDLGIGSGALAARCLAVMPRASLAGIDSDAAMLALAARRLGDRVTTTSGDFLKVPLPVCDVATASFALHHIRTARHKASFYARLHRALRPRGVLVNADCCLAASDRIRRRDRDLWLAHLAARYGRARARGFLRAWATEDVYFSLDQEVRFLRRAGFVVDVTWRRASFAVIVGTKVARQTQ